MVEGCTIRSYSFDASSNRTAMDTKAPAGNGDCQPATTGTAKIYSYDDADRLTGTGIEYDEFGRTTVIPAQHAGGGALAYTCYANDQVRTISQDEVSKTYALDPLDRQRQSVATGGTTHTWTPQGSSTVIQLTNHHGDIIATASDSATATALTARFETDEFGNPRQPAGADKRYGWLGGKQRRTELASGVIQMGVRSYVPAIGRFTSIDSVVGGSANPYDYGNADPVNQIDPRSGR